MPAARHGGDPRSILAATPHAADRPRRHAAHGRCLLLPGPPHLLPRDPLFVSAAGLFALDLCLASTLLFSGPLNLRLARALLLPRPVRFHPLPLPLACLLSGARPLLLLPL